MNKYYKISFDKVREYAKHDLSELLSFTDVNVKGKTSKQKLKSASNVANEMYTKCLAACCVASEKALGLTPFDEQLMAALALYEGKAIEMKTGEGKTLSAVFAAFLYVKSNHKLHIFTFNDYLAKRDYHWMKPVYDLLGVKIALVTEKSTFKERQLAYNEANVVYSTVKECGFDFLRDFMVFDSSQKLHPHSLEQGEFNFDIAIFDEADSVLIDEARIPLTIAGDVDATISDEFMKAFEFAKTLNEDDYGINHEILSAFLTNAGIAKVEKYFEMDNLYDDENIEVRCNIETAMKALFYLSEDKDYVVKGGRIQLIDTLSGRIARHRLFPGALQAAVEAKHDLKVTERGVVTGTIPIQFFARQYSQIAAMTGTAKLAEEEFELLYGLEVKVIPPHTPSKRVDNPPKVYYDSESKWNAIVEEVARVHAKGQPVLIGTTSIDESEMLAQKITEHLGGRLEIPVAVLNAKNDEMEAEIIKNAGVSGTITVSTNMAGRGIDIKLGGADATTNCAEYKRVVEAGGLFIIGTTLYENARMNEQLNGRAGRQGDIGETVLFIALDDEIMVKYELKKLVGKWNYPKPTPHSIEKRTILKEVKRIQRIAQGALLAERKRLLRFTMIGEKHRDAIFQKRLQYLDGTLDKDVSSIWLEHAEDDYNKAIIQYGESKIIELERKVILSSINEIWCDYLEYTSELRTGIHLRAVAGRNPAEEYNIDCERYFEGLESRLIEKVLEILEEILTLPESDSINSFNDSKLFRPKNARTFLMDESGDELVRRPIMMGILGDESFTDEEEENPNSASVESS